MKYLLFTALLLGGTSILTPHTDEAHDTHTATFEIPSFLEASIGWLAAAQFDNGGWGAGLHSRQGIRDPHAVDVDPATTAFAAMALMRSGHTLTDGKYSDNVRKAYELILQMIEESDEESLNITSIRGTQPQRKLGQNIDVSMASQFLMKVKPQLDDDQQVARLEAAVDKCLRKLERGQNQDGSFAQGGWAPVLQSVMATNSLEMAADEGYVLDEVVVGRAKGYQKRRDRKASRDDAGVPLYSLTSTQRATNVEAIKVERMIDVTVDDMSEKALEKKEQEVVNKLLDEGTQIEEAEALASSFIANKVATQQLQVDGVWVGFGNNGGEEFLSYMLTSESMAQQGGDTWEGWYDKMTANLSNIQNNDGSWSGHHCITSPVFCTSAVILAVTANNDPDLQDMAQAGN